MNEKHYCPKCKVTELHEVYFADNESALRCMECDTIFDENCNVIEIHRSQPP